MLEQQDVSWPFQSRVCINWSSTILVQMLRNCANYVLDRKEVKILAVGREDIIDT